MLFQDPESFLNEIQRIAELGADQLMVHWRNLTPDQISHKARNDLVSAADFASEQAIVNAIQKQFPDHNILSEEAGWNASSENGPTWIIDPLDGTTNFVQGIPQFAVSVGVAVNGRVDFGVIIDPCKKDTFAAARGLGFHWNGKRCTVSSRAGLEGAVLATGFPFKAHRLLDPYLDIFRDVFLRCKAIRRPGAAALDLAYTACGLFDGFFEFKLSAWDIAAGAIMIEEAGGIISDMAVGGDFMASGDVVCGSPGVYRQLHEVISTHVEKWQ